jgi:hypothetical protein
LTVDGNRALPLTAGSVSASYGKAGTSSTSSTSVISAGGGHNSKNG